MQARLLGNLLQKAGPYLLLELLLPGGTLFLLLLFLYQWRKQRSVATEMGVGAGVARAIGKLCVATARAVRVPRDIASLWRGRHRERDGLEALALAPMP
jgi:hypothetical protein